MTPDEAKQKAQAIVDDQGAEIILAVGSSDNAEVRRALRELGDAIAAALLEAAR